MPVFDLPRLFKDVFGYDPPTTDANKANLPQAPARREQSKLGQPFYMTDLSGCEFFLPVTINDMLIPFAVIGMTWKKTIVSTPMVERGGSVKELINVDDYQFTLKGILIDDDGNFPDGQIMDLFDLFSLNQSVVIHSALTDIVLNGKSNLKKDDPSGHKVVIKSIDWPEVSGVEHAKPFSMELESDLVFDLELA